MDNLIDLGNILLVAQERGNAFIPKEAFSDNWPNTVYIPCLLSRCGGMMCLKKKQNEFWCFGCPCRGNSFQLAKMLHKKHLNSKKVHHDRY